MTPLVRIGQHCGGRTRQVLLKLEGQSPAGSMKGRTARALLRGLIRDGHLSPDGHVIESSSGNLAIALALHTGQLGVPFTAIIDPRTPREIRRLLAGTSAAVQIVVEQSEDGSYLSARQRRVHELIATSPGLVWTDQYTNADNPLAHYHETAPELISQCARPPDFVFVAVGTGGTVSGLARRMSEASGNTRVVAVDVVGSRATGGAPGSRLLTGIGSSQPTRFPLPDNVIVTRVRDEEAFAHARRLHDDTGIGVGGSAGATLAACARFLANAGDDVVAVCLCSDGADRYSESIYDDSWLAGHKIALTDKDLWPAKGYQRIDD